MRANIVLEVDLENLVFLWNTYVEQLRKLQVKAPAVLQLDIKQEKPNLTEEVQENNGPVVIKSNREEDLPVCSKSSEVQQTQKEDISIEFKDKDSNSSGSSSSIDVSHDTSFHDAGSLTLEDLKTTSTVLDISELIQEKTAAESAEQKPSNTATDNHLSEISAKAVEEICQQVQHDESKDGDDMSSPGGKITSNLMMESYHLEPVSLDQSGTNKMELEVHAGCPDVIYPHSAMSSDDDMRGLRISSCGDCPPSPVTPEKEGSVYEAVSRDMVGQGIEASAAFESLAGKGADPGLRCESLSTCEARRRRGLLDTPATNISNQSSRSESPLSLDSSRSETPTGTLKRAERQNELWRAIGSIDTFLMDKDIIEACKVIFMFLSTSAFLYHT